MVMKDTPILSATGLLLNDEEAEGVLENLDLQSQFKARMLAKRGAVKDTKSMLDKYDDVEEEEEREKKQ